jgi:type II secretory pathway pseudopilin PulG
MLVLVKKIKRACPAKPWRSGGMSLIEVVIASAIILLISVVLISANYTYFNTSNANLKTVKAIYLVEEGVEAVNFIKNNNWINLGTVGTNYYLTWQNNTWQATTTKDFIDGVYERKFVTEDVYRDGEDDIVLAGGTSDSNTRKLTVSVSWFDNSGTTTKTISVYVFKSND